MKKNIIAGVVLARSGSKGVKNKNLLKIKGIYLTYKAISLALANKKIGYIKYKKYDKNTPENEKVYHFNEDISEDHHHLKAMKVLSYLQTVEDKKKKDGKLNYLQEYELRLKPYWEFLLKLPSDAYSNSENYQYNNDNLKKKDKMEKGEFCKIDSDCESNKCLGGICCSSDMKDENCKKCFSKSYINIDNLVGKCNLCKYGYEKYKNQDGKCELINKKTTGSKCEQDYDCKSNNCKNKTCIESDGGICNSDSECSSGKCRSNICCLSWVNENVEKCQPKTIIDKNNPPGNPIKCKVGIRGKNSSNWNCDLNWKSTNDHCSNKNECISNICKSNKCKASDGGACSSDSDCDSGKCRSGVCCFGWVNDNVKECQPVNTNDKNNPPGNPIKCNVGTRGKNNSNWNCELYTKKNGSTCTNNNDCLSERCAEFDGSKKCASNEKSVDIGGFCVAESSDECKHGSRNGVCRGNTCCKNYVQYYTNVKNCNTSGDYTGSPNECKPGYKHGSNYACELKI